jgi:hypothetical protein
VWPHLEVLDLNRLLGERGVSPQFLLAVGRAWPALRTLRVNWHGTSEVEGNPRARDVVLAACTS